MQLFVNARFLTQPISGVQRYGIEISRQIKKWNPETVFLSPGNILHKDLAEELGVRVIGKNTGHLWEQFDLKFHLRKNDALFNPGNTAPLFHTNNFNTLHDLAFHFYPQWNSKIFSSYYNWLIPKISNRAKHIFTVSHTIKEELQQSFGIPAKKISISYNGLPEIFSRYAPLQKEKLILCVGSLNKRKNTAKLVEAFMQSGLVEDYRLIIIGNSAGIYKDSHIEHAHPAIQWIQNLEDEQLLAWYQKAEIAVSLSLYEGFGIPVLEGLNFACKTLCSDIPVYHELYGDYVYFCDHQNLSDISDSLEALTRMPGPGSIHELLLRKYNYSDSAETILKQIASQHA